jgi:hypothetical protein
MPSLWERISSGWNGASDPAPQPALLAGHSEDSTEDDLTDGCGDESGGDIVRRANRSLSPRRRCLPARHSVCVQLSVQLASSWRERSSSQPDLANLGLDLQHVGDKNKWKRTTTSAAPAVSLMRTVPAKFASHRPRQLRLMKAILTRRLMEAKHTKYAEWLRSMRVGVLKGTQTPYSKEETVQMRSEFDDMYAEFLSDLDEAEPGFDLDTYEQFVDTGFEEQLVSSQVSGVLPTSEPIVVSKSRGYGSLETEGGEQVPLGGYSPELHETRDNVFAEIEEKIMNVPDEHPISESPPDAKVSDVVLDSI